MGFSSKSKCRNIRTSLYYIQNSPDPRPYKYKYIDINEELLKEEKLKSLTQGYESIHNYFKLCEEFFI